MRGLQYVCFKRLTKNVREIIFCKPHLKHPFVEEQKRSIFAHHHNMVYAHYTPNHLSRVLSPNFS